MAYEKQYVIADHIISKTNSGNLDWQPSFNEGDYDVDLSSYTLRISRERNYETGAPLYSIKIINKDGDAIEEFNDETLDAERNEFREINYVGAYYYNSFKTTYEVIKRKALKIDDALDAIILELHK